MNPKKIELWGNIPAMEYCSIEKAAKLLSCDIDDILHFGAIGAIRLGVYLDEHSCTLQVFKDNENLVDLFCSPEIDEYPTIIHSIFYVNENEDGYEVDEDKMYFLLRGATRGFWEIDLCVLMGLEFGRKRLMEDVGLFPFLKQEFKNHSMRLCINGVHKKPFGIDVPEGYKCNSVWLNKAIEKSHLWILKDDIEFLYKKRQEDVPLFSAGFKDADTSPFNLIPPHPNKERHAVNREKLYKAAIHILSAYPDECRGKMKEISAEKWLSAIKNHISEVPILHIANDDVILRHLRAAINFGTKQGG